MKMHPDLSDLGKTELLFPHHLPPWIKHPSLFSSSLGGIHSISLTVLVAYLHFFQPFCTKKYMYFETRGRQQQGLVNVQAHHGRTYGRSGLSVFLFASVAIIPKNNAPASSQPWQCCCWRNTDQQGWGLPETPMLQ